MIYLLFLWSLNLLIVSRVGHTLLPSECHVNIYISNRLKIHKCQVSIWEQGSKKMSGCKSGCRCWWEDWFYFLSPSSSSHLERSWSRSSWSGHGGRWGRSGGRCLVRCSWPSSPAGGSVLRTEPCWSCPESSWWGFLKDRKASFTYTQRIYM